MASSSGTPRSSINAAVNPVNGVRYDTTSFFGLT